MKQASKKTATAARSKTGRRKLFYRSAVLAAWIDQGVCSIYRKAARNWACSALLRAAVAEELSEAKARNRGAADYENPRRRRRRYISLANRRQIRLKVESALMFKLRDFIGTRRGLLADFVQVALENYIVRRLKQKLRLA